MVTVDMDAILAKIKGYIESPEGQAEVNAAVRDAMLGKIKLESGESIHTPEEAAEKFIEVLRNAIASSGLSEGAISAVSEINHTSATSDGNNTFSVLVYFSGDLSRPSLDVAKYGGIDDIVDLFDEGVDHTMKPVHGVWHGQETWSRTVIPGAHFIDQAISDFMGNYASEYNVVSISKG